MIKSTYTVSTYDRHKAYLCVLTDNRLSKLITRYNYITKYLFDEKISPNNEDDIFFLKDLLFVNMYGSIHFQYYYWILGKKYFIYNKKISDILSRYSEFLREISIYFLYDFFYYVFFTKKDIIDDVFQKFSYKNKILFIDWAMQTNPSILELISGIESMILFI